MTIANKPVRLEGVCPQLVEIVGSGNPPAAVAVRPGADGSQLRGVTIRSPGIAVAASGAQDVVFEHLHVRDSIGFVIQDDLGPTSCTIRSSLLERCFLAGLYVEGAEATLESSVVRKSVPDGSSFGRGVSAIMSSAGRASSVTIRSSLLEQNNEFSAVASGSELTLEGSVVRDTYPNGLGELGRGFSIELDPETGAPSRGSIRQSLLERNHSEAVFASGSELTIEATVVRDTLLGSASTYAGRGLIIRADFKTKEPAHAIVRRSVVERSHETAVVVQASTADIESVVVRDTAPNGQGLLGRALTIQSDFDHQSGTPAVVRVTGSILARSQNVGLFVAGSEATIESTAVLDTVVDADGLFGRGMNFQMDPFTGGPSTVMVRTSRVERSENAGVAVVDSLLTIEDSVVKDSRSSSGVFGDGVLVVSFDAPSEVSLDRTSIDDSVRAGVSNFAAFVSIGSTAIGCAAFGLNGERFKDREFSFEDRNDNLCGCPPVDGACKVLSAGLLPPQPP